MCSSHVTGHTWPSVCALSVAAGARPCSASVFHFTSCGLGFGTAPALLYAACQPLDAPRKEQRRCWGTRPQPCCQRPAILYRGWVD
jgi:hypothetical protein